MALTVAALSLAGYLAIAAGLILSQWPGRIASGRTLTFLAPQDAEGGGATDVPLRSYRTRDGADLGLRRFAARGPGAPLVVIVHGSGWHGEAYVPIARHLSQHGNFEVLLPDLRGHGVAPERRGDVGYIGAFEDDLADLIAAHRTPGQPVFMIGHSSGGGLVIRFAAGRHCGVLDKAVLLSPFLKHDAPTMRTNAGGWSHPLVRRTIGLAMLNALGIRVFNGLTVIQFRFPPEVLNGPRGDTATTHYSYRLNTSYAPRGDYLADVAKLPPFLLLAGAEDEAFDAAQFKPLLSGANPHGTYAVLPGVGHLGLIGAPDALARVRAFLET